MPFTPRRQNSGMARDYRQVLYGGADVLEEDRANLTGLLIESRGPKPYPQAEAAWTR